MSVCVSPLSHGCCACVLINMEKAAPLTNFRYDIYDETTENALQRQMGACV